MKVVWEPLGILFFLLMPNFCRVLSSKGWYMYRKNEIEGQVMALCEGNFDNFYCQKTRFLDFLRVIL